METLGWHRIILLMSLKGLFLGGLGYLLGGWRAALAVILLFIVLILFLYHRGDRLLMKWYRARVVMEYDYPNLYEIVDKLSSRVDIPRPKVALAPVGTPNAFSTGKKPDDSIIVLTYGLLRVLDAEEVEGVLAHEIAHIAFEDTPIQTFASVIASLILGIGYGVGSLVERLFPRKEEGNHEGNLVLKLLAPFAGFFLRFTLTPQREFIADERAILISGKPLALASALVKIEKAISFRPMKGGNLGTAPLFIVDPFRDELARYVSTHPPTEERAERLLRIAEEKKLYS